MRQATSDDYDHVKEMVLTFNHGYYDVPVKLDKLRAWYDRHLTEGVILIGKNSFVAALWFLDPVRDTLALVETGWYADDGHGARLLLGLIKYAKEGCADELRVCTLDTSPPEAEHLLSRLGFEMNKERSHRLKF